MKSVGIGELKARFSQILDEVRDGHRVAIQYGRKKKTVAWLIPPENTPGPNRKLGILAGKASFRLKGDFKMTDAEFLGE